MRIERIFLTSVICLICLHIVNIYGQITDKEEYEILLAEANLFQKYNVSENSQQALLDSAKYYAKDGLHDIANVFLEQLLEKYNTPKNISLSNSQLQSILSTKPYELIIRSGIDFNRQEFEVGFIQTDSVLVDEIKKPFIGIQYHYLFAGNQENGLKLSTALRYDKENLKGMLDFTGMLLRRNVSGSLQIGVIYDKNDLYKDLGYFESNSRQYFNWTLHPRWRLQFDNTFRYKNYKSPSVSVPSFFKDLLYLNISYNDFVSESIQLKYQADYNESIDFENNDYFEQTGSLSGEKWFLNSLKYNFEVGFCHNNFSYVLGDSLIKNQARSYFHILQSQIPIFNVFKWDLEYLSRYKNYSVKSEQDPDYYYHLVNSSLRKRITDNISVEAGYRFENKKHLRFKGSEVEYIKEQDYQGNGLLIGLDYSNLSNYFFSLSGSYTWRRYPNNETNDELSIYTDRNILSVFLIIQVPLYKNLHLNVFTSYDNDQDLDSDENNTRSSIFSAELQYKL